MKRLIQNPLKKCYKDQGHCEKKDLKVYFLIYVVFY